MKNTILLLMSLFFLNYINAQEPKEHITYYDFVSAKNIKESGQINQDGFPVGEWKYYLKNGILAYKINHTTNISKEFYASGQLKSKGQFDPLTGAHIGEWSSFYQNGQLKTKGVYDENGEKNSEFRTYNEDGTIKSIEVYKKGVIQK